MPKVANLSADLTCNSTSFNKNVEKSRQYMRRAGNDIGSKAKKVDKGVSSAFANAGRNVAILHGPLGGVASRLSSVATSISGIGLAMTGTAVLFGSMTLALVKAAAVGDRYNLSAKKTEALLKATGGASGLTAEQIRNMSNEVALSTLASVEGTEKAAQKLLTFKSISGDVFKKTLEISQDLAELGFGTIETSAVQLAKALEDPKLGLTALRRIGVSFTESQKEQIKAFVETNDLASAQELILATLAAQVGGTSKAAADSMAGAQDTLNQRMQEFFNMLDKRTGATAVSSWAYNSLSNYINDVNRLFDPSLKSIDERHAEVIVKILQKKQDLDRMIEAGQGKGKFYLFGDNPVENAKKEIEDLEKQAALFVEASKDKQKKQKEAEKQAEKNKESAASENRMASIRKAIKKAVDDEEKAKKKAAETLENYKKKQLEEIAALTARNDELFRGSGILKEANITQELYQASAAAGVDILSEEGQKIAENIKLKHRLNDAVAEEVKQRQKVIEKIRNYFEKLDKEREDNQEGFKSWGRSVAQDLGQATANGENLLGVLENIGRQLASRALTNLIFNPFVDAITAGGGESFAKIFGGGKRLGGPVLAGKRYLVGEDGPEIFNPGINGTIIPNGQLGGSGGNIGGNHFTFKVDARGATDPQEVSRQVQEGILSVIPIITNLGSKKTIRQMQRTRMAL